MVQRVLFFVSFGILAACAREMPDQRAMAEQEGAVKSAVLAGCLQDNEPKSVCTCVSDALVTNIDPEVLGLFHRIVSEDGIEELNHGDWMNKLDETLKAKAEAQIGKIRATCEF